MSTTDYSPLTSTADVVQLFKLLGNLTSYQASNLPGAFRVIMSTHNPDDYVKTAIEVSTILQDNAPKYNMEWED